MNNTQAEIILRPLTMSDLKAVTEVHRRAFPGSAMTALGPETVRRYYAWQLTGPHDVTAVAAFQNNQLTGFYFGGIFRGALSGFLAQERAFLAWRVITHPWLALNPLFRQRLTTGIKVLRKKLMPPKAKAPAQPITTGTPAVVRPRQFGILAIAVHPDAQGSGIGKVLMASAEQTARALQFAEMQLNVAPENVQAVRFYERLGWQRVQTNQIWKGDMIKPLH